ncbi:hypothetical protein C8Q75DRAFT_758494, partial [Abortiporus biennis]
MFWRDHQIPAWTIIDATRISDGRIVILKRIRASRNPYELEITRFLSSKSASDPRNHCIPLYDAMEVPDMHGESAEYILVLRLLCDCDDPPMQIVGEFVDFLTQIIEGVQYMHEQNVAHRDIMVMNTMMDPNPMFPDLFHPQAPKFTKDIRHFAKYFSKTVKPPRYYL